MFGVVILAAGASSRMGRPKMLLPWGSNTVLGQSIHQWRKISAAQVAVACAANDATISAELDKVGIPDDQRIVNSDPRRGMFSSIQCAACWGNWNPALAHIAIALGDQPHLAVKTLRMVADFTASLPADICQPSYRGRPRHPVFIPLGIFKSIAAANTGTLKDFLREHTSATRLVEINDPGLDLDLDTPEDYEKAQMNFARD